jgi:hypothetical protein
MDGEDGRAQDQVAGLVRAFVAGPSFTHYKLYQPTPSLCARARGLVHQRRAVFYFCSTFGCSLAVLRCRMKNGRNARFTYEKDEWRLMRIDQMKSMISEF